MSSKIDIVKNLVTKNKFFQFTAAWCPDCVYTKDVFTKYGVINKVEFFDLAQYDRGTTEFNEYREAFKKVSGGVQNLPTIFVDGKFWATEHQFHDWENKGTLEAEFKKVGLLP